MAENKTKKILEEIEKLSVLELNDLVKALEEKFGVSPAMAAPATNVQANVSPTAGDQTAASEQTTFNVILTAAGTNKISVIKAVREIKPDLGLKQAKDLVEGVTTAPKEILTGANKETSQTAKKKLEEAGATVELK